MENCLIVQKNRIHLLTILLAGFITYCISVKAGFLILDDYSILNKSSIISISLC
jgi:hypothetical protein